MKLLELWERIGKQPLRVTKNKDAIVFVKGEGYEISGIRYESGKIIGFETKEKPQWYSEMIQPEEHKRVIVMDESGRKYKDHEWVGHAWYRFVGEDGGLSDIDIVSWRYQ